MHTGGIMETQMSVCQGTVASCLLIPSDWRKMEGGGKRTKKHGARFFLIAFLSPSVRPSVRPTVRPVRRSVPLRWCRLCVIVLYSPQHKHARGRTNRRTERSPNRSRSLDFGSFRKRLSNTHQRTPRTYGAWRSCAHGYSSQWHAYPSRGGGKIRISALNTEGGPTSIFLLVEQFGTFHQ